MEKYSKFRDQATGIAPFLPNRPAKRALLTVLGQYLVGALIFPITLLGLWLSFFVMAVPGISEVWFKYVVRTVLRLFYVDISYEGERKASVRKSDIQKAVPGDVIVSNFVSPLDPIVYSGIFDCQFVFPNNGKFVPSSLVGASTQALSLDLAKGSGQPIEEIVSQAKKAGKVVVLFGEGTTSNGKAVLSLKNVDWGALAPIDSKVFTSALKYTPNTICSPLGGTYLGYLWNLQTSIWWCMGSVQISKPLAPSNRTKLGASGAMSISSRTKLVGDELDIEAKRQFSKVSKK